jgi:hypothetical protein
MAWRKAIRNNRGLTTQFVIEPKWLLDREGPVKILEVKRKRHDF